MSSQNEDPLQFFPMERWGELEVTFEADWPRGIPALSALRTQRELEARGLGHGFKVYCPYGLASNGMLTISTKGLRKDIMVECPEDYTTPMEEALSETKLIDWTKSYQIPYLPKYFSECIQRVAANVNMNSVVNNSAHYLVLYEATQPLLDDIRLPDGITYQPISEEYVAMVNEAWPMRYEGSEWVFQFLIKAKTGYGLFRNEELLCCAFISELGAVSHLYTFENHRQKGYAKMLLTLVSNKLLKEKKDIFCYCDKENVGALKLYENMGFRLLHLLKWCFLDPK